MADRYHVIMPAHNEEAVIERSLRSLLAGASAGEFAVCVVCNGCSDATAERVRDGFPGVDVLELDVASKTAAINAGLRWAPEGPVLMLDADIELETGTARSLLDAARRSGVEAAIGHMSVDLEGADWMVRAFYRVWLQHPYLRRGKFAAAFALSGEGRRRVGELPPVTADDTYLRRVVPPSRVAVLDTAEFRVRAPRTVGALVRVRSRSYRGTRQLAAHTQGDTHPGEAGALIRRLLRMPALWPLVPVYLAVTLAARGLSHRGSGALWERDLTTRTGAT